MAPDRPPRKLAAILYADVAEYSRLTGEDEEGTHRQLSAALDLVSASIEKYRGSVVHYAGDAVLADFHTVTDAIVCAAYIQQALENRNRELPDERKVQFRIGVNLGEVIVDRNDIYGDGVNVAARLEALAEPGGVCVSETVKSAAGNQLPFDYEYLGEKEVKNIAQPVKAYHARLKRDEVLPEPTGQRRNKLRVRSSYVAFMVIVLLGVGGIFSWYMPWESREEPVAVEHMAFPLPDKPSIAILPFINISGEPEQEYFVDGITEDIITDLSKLSGLFVIARNSTFTYKGKAVPVRRVAQDLGVRYVLEGSVRRSNDKLRINAQLIDAISGGHIWAERYDLAFSEVFAVQDEVTRKIVNALAISLTADEEVNREYAETSNHEAYDIFLRGWTRYRKGTPSDLARAVFYFERAIELDPTYGRAYAALAAVYWTAVDRDRASGTTVWSRSLGIDTDGSRRHELQYLERALENPTPLAYQVAAGRHSRQGAHDKAIEYAKSAIELDPGDPIAHEALAIALIYAGKPAEGEDELRHAMRLDPLLPHRYLYWMGLAQYGQGHFEEAVKSLSRAASGDPDDASSRLLLAATLGHLGRTREAKSAIDQANALREKNQQRVAGPDVQEGIDMLLAGPYTLEDVDLLPFKKQIDRERLREGLRSAGVPETGTLSQTSPIEVDGATTVNVIAAKALFDRGALFVDVRGKESWNGGHVPKAIHLPLKSSFSEENLLAVSRKDQDIVIYCMGPRCLLSSRACVKAVAWGFQNVYYFRDGFPSWKAEGFPVVVPDQ